MAEVIRCGPVDEGEIAAAMNKPVELVRCWCRNLRMEKLTFWAEIGTWTQ